MNKAFRTLKNGKYCRKMQNNTCETISEDEYLHGGRVKYDSTEKKWTCLDCGYCAAQGNSKSAILHRHKHVKDKRLQDEKAFADERTSVGLDDTQMENRFLALNLNPVQTASLDAWVNENKKGRNDARSGNEIEPQNINDNEAHNGENGEKHHYERLNFVTRDDNNNDWVCQVNNCGRRFTDSQGMSKHVSRMHTTLKTAERKKCPYCPKYYTHLKDMLMHLAINKNVTRKGGWANAICAHLTEGENIHTKWRKLEQANQDN